MPINLPPSLTTVTKFTKFLAIFIFVVLVLAAFMFGLQTEREYTSNLGIQEQSYPQNCKMQPAPLASENGEIDSDSEGRKEREIFATTDIYYLTNSQYEKIDSAAYSGGTRLEFATLANGEWEVDEHFQNIELLRKGDIVCTLTNLWCGALFTSEAIAERTIYCNSKYSMSDLTKMRNSGNNGMCCISLMSEAKAYFSCIDLSKQVGQEYTANAKATSQFLSENNIVVPKSMVEKSVTEYYSMYE